MAKVLQKKVSFHRLSLGIDPATNLPAPSTVWKC